MTRLYNVGTVSVTNSDTAVTGSGTAFIGNVLASDELGIGAFLSRTVDFPLDFFTIASDPATDTDLVLSSAYTGATANGQSYLISQVSSIENNELNLCSVILAMALAKRKDGDYQGYSALWTAGIMRARDEAASLDIDASSNEPMIPAGATPYPGSIDTDYT